MQPPQWHQPGGLEVPAGGPHYEQPPPAHRTAVPTWYGPPAGLYPPRWEYARKSRRLIAALIDSFLLNTIVSSVTVFLYAGIHREKHGIAYSVVSALINAIFTIFVIVLPQARWGQTLGKRAMDIRVVRAGAGGAIGYGQSTLRELIFFPLGLISVIVGGITAPLDPLSDLGDGITIVGIGAFVISLIDLYWITIDPRRQALHDKAAQTVVVHAGPGMPNPYKT